MRKRFIVGAALAGVALAGALAQNNPITLFSTLFVPVTEAQAVRDILRNSPTRVEFVGSERNPYFDRIFAEAKSGRVTTGLLLNLHGDMPSLVAENALEPVDDVLARLSTRNNIPRSFQRLAVINGKAHYIPWLQASFIMGANRQALQYLPSGADVNNLTYRQLRDWGANIQKATNRRLLGFPAGPTGLFFRFVQGYMLPSYTGSSATRFRSTNAQRAWREFKEIWRYANPQSTGYGFMQDPLLSGEVWVAWDHSARLLEVAKQRPNDFVLFPAPSEQFGRGYMGVIAGLAIPKGTPNRAAAVAAIEYLTRPEVVTNFTRGTGYFAISGGALPADMDPGIKAEAAALAKQSGDSEALQSLPPAGFGTRSNDLNKIYTDTFVRIVLRNEDIKTVLDQQAEQLRALINEVKAPCWAPDAASSGPCPVQ